MREIRSPLDGILSPFQARAAAAVDAYAVQGLSPLLVADFTTPYYRKAGAVSTFDSTFTHSRLGNATMVDSDGLIKWAPHNLITYSNEFSNAVWRQEGTPIIAQDETAPDGTVNTAWTITDNDAVNREGLFRVSLATSANAVRYNFCLFVKKTTGAASFPGMQLYLSGGTPQNGGVMINTNTGVLTDRATFSPASKSIIDVGGFWLVCITMANNGTNTGIQPEFYPAITASDTGTWDNTLTGSAVIYGDHLYRSDLGGMVNNPDRGDSYVPTTSAAVHQARRNHYTYNGSAWINSGLLLETEARTNGITYSNDLSSGWTVGAITHDKSFDGPLGIGTAIEITVTAGGGNHWWYILGGGSGDRASSVFAKAGTVDFICIASNGASSDGVWFDLSTGTVGTENGSSIGLPPEDYGDGWYRCTAIIPNAGFSTLHACRSDGEIQSFSALGTETIFVSGHQLEAGSTSSSYMHTTSGATFTRPTESLQIAAADMPWDASNVSLQMQGKMTYADEGAEAQNTFARWYDDANNYITIDLDTDSTDTGEVNFEQQDGTGGTGTVTIDTYSPGILVPYNIASRNTSTAINGATGGTAGTEDTTPTALPDLSAKDFSLGHDYMGTIGLFRAWNKDIGDTGIEDATS